MSKITLILTSIFLLFSMIIGCGSNSEVRKDKQTSQNDSFYPPGYNTDYLKKPKQEDIDKMYNELSKPIIEDKKKVENKISQIPVDKNAVDKNAVDKFVADIDMIKRNLNNGEYKNPADETEEELQSYIDNRWCKNPRGVEWLYFAGDVELYLKVFSENSSYGNDMLKDFKAVYYGDKDGSAHMLRSGQENIDLTIRWLDQSITNMKNSLDN